MRDLSINWRGGVFLAKKQHIEVGTNNHSPP